MNELVSVIIPAYNHEKYVQETIWSIINQTYENIELIIINDGSKDNTHEKILELEDECKKRFVRFEYKLKQNAGVSASLNDGIDLANGKYTYTIASDDIAKPEAIETLYEIIKDKPDYALVVGNDDFIDSNSEYVVVDKFRNIINDEIKENEEHYKTLAEWSIKCNNQCNIDFHSVDFGSYYTLLFNCYLPNGYLINKKAILDAGKYKKDCAEDWYIFLQLAKKYKFKYVDKILFSYRCHSTNSQKNNRYMREIVKNTFKNEKEYCYKNNYKEIWDRKWNLNTHQKIYNLIPTKLEKIFRGWLRRALKEAYNN